MTARNILQFFYLFLMIAIFSNRSTVSSQTTVTLDSTVLTEREVAIGLQVPWELRWGPDDYLWVTEKRGRVLRIDPETGNTNTVLNIENEVQSGSEPGLLGMAIHPDFANVPKVYLAYTFTVAGSNTEERLVSYDWNDTVLSNEVILLDGIDAGGIHNGARLLITPDQKILMTTGDVGNSNNSQNLNNLNGKLLRINLDGSVPVDNPVSGSYIYSYGHRNSQGLAYGPNGQLYSSEHGPNSSDEFNLIESNRNYGWPTVMGACNTPAEINYCNANNVREPLTEYTPCVAVNDLAYYDHDAIPEWKGKMLMAVLGGFVQDPRLSVLTFNNDGSQITDEKTYFENYGRIRDVCINPHNGAIFFATNGTFYPSSGPNRIIEYRNLAYVTDTVPDTTTGVSTPGQTQQFFYLFPNIQRPNDQVTIECAPGFIGYHYQLFSFKGEKIMEQKITNTKMLLSTDDLPAGNYFIKASNPLGVITQKVVIR